MRSSVPPDFSQAFLLVAFSNFFEGMHCIIIMYLLLIKCGTNVLVNIVYATSIQ